MKSVKLAPITGLLDLRSNPEDVPQNGYRWVLNYGVQQKLKLCRNSGWSKLLDRSPYEGNWDFHDQLQSLSGVTGRRPLTFSMEATSANKSKALLVGHDRTIFALQIGTGNYRVLNTTPMGEDGKTRWYGAQNGDVTALTNDFDPPQYWTFDADSIQPIADLATIGITRVAVIVEWVGVTLYANVVENGAARPNKILWSDLDKPLSLIPSDNSIAGSIEAQPDEAILNMVPLGNVLIVYTTKRIWQLQKTGDDFVFALVKRYDPEDGEACLAYRNSIITKGDEHVYASRTGIYSYNQFVTKPTLVEFINRSSSYIYDTIDQAKCDWFVGHYNADRREIYFSWVDTGFEIPTKTLVINTEFPFSGIIDHGFTAFGVFQPNEPITTLKQFILDQCICDSAEFASIFGEPENEGGPCVTPPVVTCESQPDSFFTTVTQELEDGIIMEDWNEIDPSENSLCNRLAGSTISSLCLDESRRDQCNAGRLFVMASAGDYCLKQLSESFYREVCTAFTGCGTYSIVGYKSILRTGPLSFKDVADEKRITRFIVEAIAASSNVPGQMALRVGTSSMALDPNQEECGIIWFSEDPISLDCVAVATATHNTDKTRPDTGIEFPAFTEGQWLYIELTVENPNSTPIDTGASVCMSSFVADISPVQRRY